MTQASENIQQLYLASEREPRGVSRRLRSASSYSGQRH
jgi:hypothetical protein